MTVTGTVLDPSGKPIGGTQVFIMSSGGLNAADGVDPDGHYSISWQPWRFGDGGSNFLLAYDADRNLVAIHGLDAKATNIDLHMESGTKITGFVKDTKGRPVENASLRLYLRIGGTTAVINQQPVTTDSQGIFQFTALPHEQKYTLYTSAVGYGTDSHNIAEDQTKADILRLPIVLKVANLPLAGMVVGIDDKPAEGVTVRMEGVGQPTGSATTDAAGHFELEACDGDVRVSASQPFRRNGQIAPGTADARGGDTSVIIKLGTDNFLNTLKGVKVQ